MSLIRSFVAIDIPDGIKKSVQDWIEPLKIHDTSVKWLRPEAMHLTLKFLGSVEEGRFENEFFKDFTQLLSPFKPITLKVRDKGAFPPNGIPHVLWLGLKGDIASLIELAGAVGNFFTPFGFPPEKRSFSPHLTLARIRQKPSSGFLKVWREMENPTFGEFTAKEVVFYRSELTKNGAIYSVIRKFKF